MEYCSADTLEQPSSWYFITLYTTFTLGVIINIYVVYCIIFLSNRQMKTYRWYLLWHQSLVFLSDILINFLGQPVIFYPFRMGYPAGLLKDIIPPVHFVVLVMLVMYFQLCSDAHLFIYRLVTTKGYEKFPWPYKLWAGVLYLLAAMGAFMQAIESQADKADTIRKYSQKYSCVTEALLQIPHFMIFDEDEKKRYKFIGPIIKWTCMVSTIFTMFICLVLALRATTTKAMSPKLVRVQRRFLGQLVVLIFVPLSVLLIPTIGFCIVLDRKLFGYNALGYTVIVIGSSVSIIGGIALVLVNPSYHWIFSGLFKRATKISQQQNGSNVVVLN